MSGPPQVSPEERVDRAKSALNDAEVRVRRTEATAGYAEATEGLWFSKDFWTHQEAIIHDPMETSGARFMAWLKRRSWGEFSLFAIGDDGRPLGQKDAAKELGIDNGIICNVVRYYESRGYVRREGRKLYPVIAPSPTAPPEKAPHSPDFKEFLKDWKVTHSPDFEALELARSTVKKIRKAILSDYKRWSESHSLPQFSAAESHSLPQFSAAESHSLPQFSAAAKSLAPSTNGAPILIEIKPLDKEEEDEESVGRQVEAPSISGPEEPTDLPTASPSPSAEIIPDPRDAPGFREVVEVVEEVAVPVIGESPTDLQYVDIHRRLKGASPEHFRQRIETKKAQGKLNSVMVLRHLADDCARTRHKWKPPTKAASGNATGRKSFFESVTQAAEDRLKRWGRL